MGHGGEWRTRTDLKELAAGAIFVLVAAMFAVSALRNLALGSPGSMGPGFFPLMVAVCLAVIGVAVILRAFAGTTAPIAFVGWRPVLLILVAPAIYALTVTRLGFIAAVALTVLVSAWASRRMTVRFLVPLVVFLTALCTVVFVYLLGMPVPLVGRWFTP